MCSRITITLMFLALLVPGEELAANSTFDELGRLNNIVMKLNDKLAEQILDKSFKGWLFHSVDSLSVPYSRARRDCNPFKFEGNNKLHFSDPPSLSMGLRTLHVSYASHDASGVVKAWYPQKGFGFVTLDGEETKDVFVHSSALVGVESLSNGDKVVFTAQTDRRGRLQAANLKVKEHSADLPRFVDLPLRSHGINYSVLPVSAEIFFEEEWRKEIARFAIDDFVLRSSLNCAFLVVSEQQLVEKIRAPSAEEFERITSFVESYIADCESRKVVMLADFEGEMLGYGGEMTTAQLQVTFTIDDNTLEPQLLPLDRLFKAPGFIFDLRDQKTVGLLRRILQSPDITKLMWGAVQDFQCLLSQTAPVPLLVNPEAVVDVQLGFTKDIRYRMGMSEMLNHVNRELTDGLPAKDQIDWNTFHAHHQRAMPLPLKHDNAMYAVDDLHRIEAILRNKVPFAGSYASARNVTERVLIGQSAFPLGFHTLYHDMMSLERFQGMKRTAKAVGLTRHVLWIRSIGTTLSAAEEGLLKRAEEVARAQLEQAGVPVPSDLSFRSLV